MIIKIKAKKILDLGLWDKYCEVYGISVWAINEGLMDEDEWLTISTKKLGIKPEDLYENRN